MQKDTGGRGGGRGGRRWGEGTGVTDPGSDKNHTFVIGGIDPVWFVGSVWFELPGRGLEPPQPFGHMALNHARLPIPPPGPKLITGRDLSPARETYNLSLTGECVKFSWPRPQVGGGLGQPALVRRTSRGAAPDERDAWVQVRPEAVGWAAAKAMPVTATPPWLAPPW